MPYLHSNDLAADGELAARIRAGDSDAFTALVDAYANVAVRLAYRMLSSRDAAYDVVQNVLADMWARREQFAPTHSIRAYLLGAVRLQALKELRQHDLHTGRRPADDPDTIAVESPAAASDNQMTVATLLQRLSERRRTAIQLRYIEQLSYAEVAQVMAISIKAVEQHVLRALADLRRIVVGKE